MGDTGVDITKDINGQWEEWRSVIPDPAVELLDAYLELSAFKGWKVERWPQLQASKQGKQRTQASKKRKEGRTEGSVGSGWAR